MRRREFMKKLMAGGAVAVTAGIGGLAARQQTKRCVEAVRGRRYPGPVLSLTRREIAVPGLWAG